MARSTIRRSSAQFVLGISYDNPLHCRYLLTLRVHLLTQVAQYFGRGKISSSYVDKWITFLWVKSSNWSFLVLHLQSFRCSLFASCYYQFILLLYTLRFVKVLKIFASRKRLNYARFSEVIGFFCFFNSVLYYLKNMKLRQSSKIFTIYLIAE